MKLKELLRSIKLDEFIAIDLETTGLDPRSDAITEISAYRFVDGEPHDEFSSLINPGIPIPDDIAELTGITNQMVKNAPEISEILPKLLKYIGDKPLVGHKISFDLSFLEHQIKLQKLQFGNSPIFDTLQLSSAFLFFHHQFNLGGVSEYFGISSKGSHRAGIDTLNTGKIFVHLVREAASYPLPVIDKILDAVQYFNIPNIKLYEKIIETALNSQQVGGLISSVIDKPSKNNVFRHTSHSDNKNLVDDPADWFQKDSLIPKKWTDYEPRNSQIELTSDIFEAFNKETIHLAEAGTGLGKSLAYLAAGILYSTHSEIPLIVSTYTKNLQDQLFLNDIPRLTECLDLNLNAVLLKGRHNYICKTRLERVLQNPANNLTKFDSENLAPILVWLEHTTTGDISECNGFPLMRAGRLWGKMRSEPGYCTTQRCSDHSGCYLGKVRSSLKKAQLIVVNHSLLLSELLQDAPNLPQDFVYVIDEGHNLENAAKDQLIEQINEHSFNEIFNFFSKTNSQFHNELAELTTEKPDTETTLNEIFQHTSIINKELKAFFKSYLVFKSGLFSDSNFQYEKTFIYTNARKEFLNVTPSPFDILESLQKLKLLLTDFHKIVDESGIKENSTFSLELVVHLAGFKNLLVIFDRTLKNDADDIVWSSFIRLKGNLFPILKCAPRDVSTFLYNGIFARKAGGVVCSATLTVNDKFQYLSNSIGIHLLPDDRETTEKTYVSPFYYKEQMQLFVFSSDIKLNTRAYLYNIADQIDKFTKQIPKRMLVLCTSYAQTITLKNHLQKKMFMSNRKLFVQVPGANRLALIRGYLANRRSILIGTSSFWEGVDLPGDKVEILMIIKLPFANPTDPMVIAKTEKFNSMGKNAFWEYTVPDSIVRLKQGVGRLIRSLDDSGICIITDPRILKSKYGKLVLDSLPVEATSYLFIEAVNFSAKNFFMV